MNINNRVKMTKKELLKKFSYIKPEYYGICFGCAYVEFCDKILPSFHKPGKCGGPFYKKN